MSGAPRHGVYVAHPITTYGTAHEETALAALAVLLPEAELVNPSGRYTTDEGWLRAWPRLLNTLSAFVIFAAPDGTIGVGCVRELADALRMDLPVAGLVHGRLRRLDGLVLVPEPDRSRRAVATLRFGPTLAPDALRPPGLD